MTYLCASLKINLDNTDNITYICASLKIYLDNNDDLFMYFIKDIFR